MCVEQFFFVSVKMSISFRSSLPVQLRLFVLVLFVPLVIGLSLFLSTTVFRNAPITTDEHAYVFQANCFADGVIARPLPEPVRMFPHEMMIMDKEHGWLSRYPPAHAAWLTPGAFFDHPRFMIALAAVCSLFLLWRIGIVLDFPPFLLPALAGLSPYFWFMHGTLLSHTSGLVAVCLLLFSYLSWKKTGLLHWAVLAGLAWAWFFLNRTYTGFLIAIPFGMDALIDAARNPVRRNILATLLFAGSAGLGAVVFLLYNHAAIGDAFTPTYLYYQASDALGFGPRPPGKIPAMHTPWLGFKALVENLVLLDRWLYGFTGGLVLLFLLLIAGWNRRWSPLLVAAPCMVWLGYILFWFEGIRLVGPVYYYETLPFLLLILAFGLQRIWARLPLPGQWRWGLAAALPVLVASLFFSWQQGQFLYDWQELTGKYHELLRNAPEKSLVLVKKIPGMNYLTQGMAYNPKGIDSTPLVAHLGKLPTPFLVRAYPDHTPYQLTAGEGKQLELQPYQDPPPLLYRWHITQTRARTGQALALGQQKKTRYACQGIHGADWLSFGSFFWVVRGDYVLRIHLDDYRPLKAPPLEIDIVTADGQQILARQKVSCRGGQVIEIPFRIKADRMRVEPRIFFTGTGTVQASQMEIMQVSDAWQRGTADS